MTTSTPIAPPDGTAPESRGAADDRSGGADPPAQDVVVGVDGSECSLGAVRWAAQEAARRGAPLRIVHATTSLGRRGVAGTAPRDLPWARRITGQAYTVARHTARDVPARTEVIPGDPVPTLLRAGEDGQLLVLGIATTGAADEMILAPVAQRVAARATHPVVVVPRQRSAVPADRPVVAVLGLGDPEDDEPVATFAAAAAERSGVPLSVVQTRTPGSGTDADGWAERFPGLDVRVTELPRATAGQLLGETCPTPLVAMSTGHGSFLHALDGPHRWLLRHCTSPMALVPPVHRPEDEPREEIIAVG